MNFQTLLNGLIAVIYKDNLTAMITMRLVLKVSTYIIICFTACPIELAAILALMSLSTFKLLSICSNIHSSVFLYRLVLFQY